MIRRGSAGQLANLDTARFLWTTGWHTTQKEYFEWRNYPSGPIGIENYSGFDSGLYAQVYTTTGWTGGVGTGDYGTDYRYREEVLSWYSLPIGMYLEEAKTWYEL